MSLEETLKRLFTYEIRVNRQNRKRDRRNKTDPETTARLTARKFQKKMRKLNLFIPTLDNNPLLTAVFSVAFIDMKQLTKTRFSEIPVYGYTRTIQVITAKNIFDIYAYPRFTSMFESEATNVRHIYVFRVYVTPSNIFTVSIQQR